MNKRLYRLAALLAAVMMLSSCGSRSETAADRTKAATKTPTASAETENQETATAPPETTEPGTLAPEDRFEPEIRFTGTDQYGGKIDENVFRDHALTMINFWEPWCGPCVGEMPELEQLYQDRGGELLILGVYWTAEGAAEVIKQTGVTYPVLLFDKAFERFQTGYVPTTIFVDREGRVVGENYIGARSYAQWEEIITGLSGR